MKRGGIAEIDLNAIAHNLRLIRQLAGNLPVIAVIKADAYGHGAIRVAERLVSEGAGFLAVAFSQEAVELRKAGFRQPILVLFDNKDIKGLLEYELTPVVCDMDAAASLSQEAVIRGRKINIHIKVDTGMGRLGFTGRHLIRDILTVSRLRGIKISALMSHFSEADLGDMSFANLQLRRFNAVRKKLLLNGLKIDFCHMANSAAVMSLPKSYFNAVRPGLMLYGISPLTPDRPLFTDNKLRTPNSGLKPAMRVKTRILSLRRLKKGTPVSYGRTFITRRDSLIGIIPVGYADGYNRLFSNKAEMLVHGRRVRVAGRVCMDVTMIDVTDIDNVRENDEVVLLGRQGNASVTAEELAGMAGSIPYEILISLGHGSRKVYAG